ncbi:dTDP-4-dehydrorhamnose 3,5-epimerase [Parasedimentitalea maritima]|uniref:dTDP-4-dehydrorhamnose 3,5-epimerase n=1 Tax=Parasedimentitalea maritima TaxID=2578117 RepID=A0ABY2URW2_9RHOB|nr:dTDP-4-dehydrorhamnose 3,5-epimerase [Zongyanglinia marina]TLP60298.1 dTDP-4-dehydrorhamnose 3,5-epimerase [Zongyanglinia marina]
MEFHDTGLAGCRRIELTKLGDARGYFARTFCRETFLARGLNPEINQSSISFSAKRGTLRGLHFQAAPVMEDKLVRCLQGTIFDVMVDLRPGSPSYGRWYGTELDAQAGTQLYAPQGFAHGFQALTENVVVAYNIGQTYVAEKTAGVRWDDPDIGVNWPLVPSDLSPRDQNLPLLADLDPVQLIHFEDP